MNGVLCLGEIIDVGDGSEPSDDSTNSCYPCIDVLRRCCCQTIKRRRCASKGVAGGREESIASALGAVR